MEHLHEHRRDAVQSGPDGGIEFYRACDHSDWPLVLSVFDSIPEKDRPEFDNADLIKWLHRTIENPTVLVLIMIKGDQTVGFYICLAPTELSHCVWIQYAYTRPRYRSIALVLRGLKIARSWGKTFMRNYNGRVSFLTKRPRPWLRLLGEGARVVSHRVEA